MRLLVENSVKPAHLTFLPQIINFSNFFSIIGINEYYVLVALANFFQTIPHD
jgi:hypothetical protein